MVQIQVISHEALIHKRHTGHQALTSQARRKWSSIPGDFQIKGRAELLQSRAMAAEPVHFEQKSVKHVLAVPSHPLSARIHTTRTIAYQARRRCKSIPGLFLTKDKVGRLQEMRAAGVHVATACRQEMRAAGVHVAIVYPHASAALWTKPGLLFLFSFFVGINSPPLLGILKTIGCLLQSPKTECGTTPGHSQTKDEAGRLRMLAAAADSVGAACRWRPCSQCLAVCLHCPLLQALAASGIRPENLGSAHFAF
jgi:hypothetical protein